MFKLSAFADEANPTMQGQIEALKRNDMKYIDVRLIEGNGVLSCTAELRREFAKKLKSAGIKVNCIGSFLGKIKLADDFKPHLEQLKTALEAADTFESDKIRLFSFYEAGDNFKEVSERLNEFTKLAEGTGISLYLENELKLFGEKAGNVNRLLENNDKLKNVFDAANYVLAGEDIDFAISTLAHKTDFFHIKDANYKGEIVPAGYGDGKIEETLRAVNKPTALTLEPHLTHFTGYFDDKELEAKFKFKDSDEAFDAGVKALKDILNRIGKAFE